MALKFLNDGYFAGKVGIGTESPNAKLEVNSAITFSTIDTFGQLVVKAASGSTGDMLNIGVDTANSVTFIQANDRGVGTIPLSLQRYGGYVGIGTISPTTPLSIESSGSDEFIKITNTATYTGLWMNDSGTNNGWLVLSGYTDAVSLGDFAIREYGVQTSLTIKQTTGNVGIGTTSPDLKLDVTHATAGEYVATFQNTGANLELKLGVTSTSYLNIQGQQINNSAAFNISLQADGGNVGINTTIPTQKLHVVGNARVTGAYYDSNNSPGTANQVLVSTVTGTDWVDGSGSSIIGGPYLPLTAGSGKSLTGTLYGTNTNWSGDGDYAGNLTLGTGASTQEAHLQIGQGRTGNGFSYIDLIGDATYTDYGFRIIRNNGGPNTTSAITHRGTGNLEIQATDSASILLRTNNVTALTLSNTQNATFAGHVFVEDGNKFFGANAIAASSEDGNYVASFGKSTSGSAKFAGNITVGGGTSTFAGKATSLATAASDSSITLTTKSYVDGLVTGVPVYKGTWDARTQAEGGLAGDGGNPNLRLAANKILGNYYIVSTAGSATPNGAGTQPDSWNVGDWCIFSDVTPGTGTDLWQKIDNTSVISGAGTGQKVTKWEGAGPSETLTDGPITFSGNNSTFAGNVNTGRLFVEQSGADMIDMTRTGVGTYRFAISSSDAFSLFDVGANVDRLVINNSGNATFAGNGTFVGNLTVNKTTGVAITDIISGDNYSVLTLKGGQTGDAANGFGIYSGYPSAGDFTIRENGVANYLTIAKTTGNATFAGKIIAGQGVQFTGGTIGSATTVLHTNNVVYARGGSGGMFLQNADGSDGMFIANDHVRIETGSSERMRITAAGNVGIGTTSPGAKLHVAYSNSSVYSTTSPSGDLVVSRHNTSNVDNQTVGIRFDTTGFAGTTTGQAAIQAIQTSNLSSADLAFLTRNNATFGERMRITSAGELQVTGNGVIKNEHSSANFSYWQQTASDARLFTQYAQPLYFGTNASTKMTILSGGNVGIGDTTPTSKLTILGTSTAASNTPSDAIVDIHGTSTAHLLMGVANVSPYGAWINTDATGQPLVLQGVGGNVGIGVTNPNSYDSNADNLVIGSTGANDKNGITIVGGDTDGRGAVYFADTTQNSAGYISYFHSNNSMLFGTSDTTRMVIDSAGAIKFNAYDSTNNTGTPTYLLGTDASGNVVKTNSAPSPITSQAASLYDLIPNGAFTTTYAFTSTAGTYAEVMEGNDVITAAGTYSVQMFVNDYAVGGTQYSETYSGIMSWGSATNTNNGSAVGSISEIILHRSGHAANSGMTYLRTRETTSANGGKLKLEIMCNKTYTGASNVVFKFVRLI